MKKSNLKSVASNDTTTDYGGTASLSPLKTNQKVRMNPNDNPMTIKQMRSKQFMIDLNSNEDETE